MSFGNFSFSLSALSIHTHLMVSFSNYMDSRKEERKVN